MDAAARTNPRASVAGDSSACAVGSHITVAVFSVDLLLCPDESDESPFVLQIEEWRY
jgi:hypothetical protein